MKVIFTGDPQELEAGAGLSRLSTQMFGKTFPMGAEVDVSDLSHDQLRKLLGNPHFKDSSEVGAMRAPLILPASVAPAADVGVDEEEAAEAAAHAERAAAKRKKA